jgi:hypothetical protein
MTRRVVLAAMTPVTMMVADKEGMQTGSKGDFHRGGRMEGRKEGRARTWAYLRRFVGERGINIRWGIRYQESIHFRWEGGMEKRKEGGGRRGNRKIGMKLRGYFQEARVAFVSAKDWLASPMRAIFSVQSFEQNDLFQHFAC